MSQISVIIPLYNKEKYIKRALDSVFAQTYQDFEVIVIDDGSTDEGAQIVRSYNDKRLRLIEQANAGPGAARNRGINESRAEYIAFLDADDEWLPDFLVTYQKALVNHPDCDLVMGPHFEGEEHKDKSIIWSDLGFKEGAWRLPHNISYKELHTYLTVFHTCTILVKSEVVKKYGGFYSKNNCTHGEDRFLQVQLLLNHKIYRIMKPLMWYHSETNGVSAIPKQLVPLLSDPMQIRANCPDAYRNLLEQYLANTALNYAHKCSNSNDYQTAAYLVEQFPIMKQWLNKYIRLKIKLMFPNLNLLNKRQRLRYL
ncbi:MAG: glycosyltransferase family A protein [Sedimentisphaerales bacterium]